LREVVGGWVVGLDCRMSEDATYVRYGLRLWPACFSDMCCSMLLFTSSVYDHIAVCNLLFPFFPCDSVDSTVAAITLLRDS
jgi:hypothetical protein